MHSYANVLRIYMDALGRSDYATIAGLFAPEGTVRSPFLGEMPAEPFFERLGQPIREERHHSHRRLPQQRRYDACGRVLSVRLDRQRRVADHVQGDGLVHIRFRKHQGHLPRPHLRHPSDPRDLREQVRIATMTDP